MQLGGVLLHLCLDHLELRVERQGKHFRGDDGLWLREERLLLDGDLPGDLRHLRHLRVLHLRVRLRRTRALGERARVLQRLRGQVGGPRVGHRALVGVALAQPGRRTRHPQPLGRGHVLRVDALPAHLLLQHVVLVRLFVDFVFQVGRDAGQQLLHGPVHVPVCRTQCAFCVLGVVPHLNQCVDLRFFVLGQLVLLHNLLHLLLLRYAAFHLWLGNVLVGFVQAWLRVGASWVHSTPCVSAGCDRCACRTLVGWQLLSASDCLRYE